MDDREAEPPYQQPLLGLVFDLDGTLVESEHDFLRMRREVIKIAEKSGVLPGVLHPTETIPRLMEKARAELEAVQAPEGQIYRMEAEVNHVIDAIELEALAGVTVREGAANLLQNLSERGYRLGILTRSSERFCRSALERTGLADWFPYLRTRSAPGPAKPSPEALLLLLREMGVPVDRAAFVGDHLMDAECAHRAAVRFYAVLPAKPSAEENIAERFHAEGAAGVVATLGDLAPLLGVGAPTTHRVVPPSKAMGSG
ncbi:MAG: HAD family hydrolase [Thermoplasmata archaeon]